MVEVQARDTQQISTGAAAQQAAQPNARQANQEHQLVRALNRQYIIVQDKLISTSQQQTSRGRVRQEIAQATEWSKLPQQKSNKQEERFINGDDTMYSQMQNETISTLDESMFMRHGDIDNVDFKIRLDFLRDFKNKLHLLTSEDEVVFREMLERDQTRQKIAKLATSNFHLGGDSKVKALAQETTNALFSSMSETMQKASE